MNVNSNLSLNNFRVLGRSEQWLFVEFGTFWEKHPCLSLFSVDFPSNYIYPYLKNTSGVNVRRTSYAFRFSYF